MSLSGPTIVKMTTICAQVGLVLSFVSACGRTDSSATAARNNVAGGANAEKGSFGVIGVGYSEGAGGAGLSLTSSSKILSYKAQVEGGVKCFGDLYQNGTQDGVEINVAAGESLKIRKGGTDCKVTFTELKLEGGVVATKTDKGLPFYSGSTATFKRGDTTVIQVSVLKGPQSANRTIADNISVELIGRAVEQSNVVMANAERFVAVAGEAYSAPHVTLDSTMFNKKYYFGLKCIGTRTADGCQNERGQNQPLKDMAVWLTNDNLTNIKQDERYQQLARLFMANTSLDSAYDSQGFPGYRIRVGGSPIIQSAYKFAVVRLSANGSESFKVIEIKSAP